jgi:hypothetical protein
LIFVRFALEPKQSRNRRRGQARKFGASALDRDSDRADLIDWQGEIRGGRDTVFAVADSVSSAEKHDEKVFDDELVGDLVRSRLARITYLAGRPVPAKCGRDHVLHSCEVLIQLRL